MAINNNLSDFFTDIADAIREKTTKKYLAPNGVTYDYKYEYKKYQNDHSANFESEIYANYKIALLKNGYAYFAEPKFTGTLTSIYVYINGVNYNDYYIQDKCTAGDYYISRRTRPSSAFSGNMYFFGPDYGGTDNWTITTNIPIYDNMLDLENYLRTETIPINYICPKDFASLIRAI